MLPTCEIFWNSTLLIVEQDDWTGREAERGSSETSTSSLSHQILKEEELIITPHNEQQDKPPASISLHQ